MNGISYTSINSIKFIQNLIDTVTFKKKERVFDFPAYFIRSIATITKC